MPNKHKNRLFRWKSLLLNNGEKTEKKLLAKTLTSIANYCNIDENIFFHDVGKYAQQEKNAELKEKLTVLSKAMLSQERFTQKKVDVKQLKLTTEAIKLFNELRDVNFYSENYKAVLQKIRSIADKIRPVELKELIKKFIREFESPFVVESNVVSTKNTESTVLAKKLLGKICRIIHCPAACAAKENSHEFSVVQALVKKFSEKPPYNYQAFTHVLHSIKLSLQIKLNTSSVDFQSPMKSIIKSIEFFLADQQKMDVLHTVYNEAYQAISQTISKQVAFEKPATGSQQEVNILAAIIAEVESDNNRADDDAFIAVNDANNTHNFSLVADNRIVSEEDEKPTEIVAVDGNEEHYIAALQETINIRQLQGQLPDEQAIEKIICEHITHFTTTLIKFINEDQPHNRIEKITPLTMLAQKKAYAALTYYVTDLVKKITRGNIALQTLIDSIIGCVEYLPEQLKHNLLQPITILTQAWQQLVLSSSKRIGEQLEKTSTNTTDTLNLLSINDMQEDIKHLLITNINNIVQVVNKGKTVKATGQKEVVDIVGEKHHTIQPDNSQQEITVESHDKKTDESAIFASITVIIIVLEKKILAIMSDIKKNNKALSKDENDYYQALISVLDLLQQAEERTITLQVMNDKLVKQIKNLPSNLQMQLQKIINKIQGKKVDNAKTRTTDQHIKQQGGTRLKKLASIKDKFNKALAALLEKLKKAVKAHNNDKAIQDKDVESFDDTEEIFIGNAGVILFWSFLPHFLTKLGLLQNNVFIDDDAAMRAVLITHYLTHGNTLIGEQELALNKILCGVDLHQPIVNEIDITEEEKTACEGLTKAVITYWKKLQNPDINAFRYLFLHREGMIKVRDECWLLQVERKPYDILLNDLPWSISTVTNSWMQSMLYVEW
ncbi:MAG: hypothetical protein JKY13_01750 [Gammaproteobacteria bacterium]|nr:hypothetical protein [Gammaproteobacteria bacterium]